MDLNDKGSIFLTQVKYDILYYMCIINTYDLLAHLVLNWKQIATKPET